MFVALGTTIFNIALIKRVEIKQEGPENTYKATIDFQGADPSFSALTFTTNGSHQEFFLCLLNGVTPPKNTSRHDSTQKVPQGACDAE